MRITFLMNGDRVSESFERLERGMRRDLDSAAEDSARTIRDKARFSMTRPKSGTEYIFQGRKIRASARGESPAIRSGALYRSVEVSGIEHMQYAIGTPLWYGNHLETNMDRPYLLPAFSGEADRFIKRAHDIIRKQIKATK